jgi:hypothetical protein
MIFDSSTRTLHGSIQRGLGASVESEYCEHYQRLDAMILIGLKSEPGKWIDSAKTWTGQNHAQYVDVFKQSQGPFRFNHPGSIRRSI